MSKRLGGREKSQLCFSSDVYLFTLLVDMISEVGEK